MEKRYEYEPISGTFKDLELGKRVYPRDAADRLNSLGTENAELRERIKALEEALSRMLISQDAEWENKNQGHDWADACRQARDILSRTALAEGKE